VDDVEGSAVALFERVCKLDLESVVAKQKDAPYVSEREHSTWFKIRNRDYSQMVGREELFERERGNEPAPGWHSCDAACALLSA
jgi:ATP-dependent DNA ligase